METKVLTKAAKRDLQRLREGWNGLDIRYGPYRQLLDQGFIKYAPQGERLYLLETHPFRPDYRSS